MDDGSTDATADIIKRYVAKYPNNIQYIHKTNGGQASARNAGLPYAKYQWINFADPDDFFDYRCFERIDKFLSRNGGDERFCMIGMNLIYYQEARERFSDTHPLRYKFKNKETVLNVRDLDHYIQLSAASALLKRDLVTECSFCFSEKCKPAFEDAVFVNAFLVNQMDKNDLQVAYLSGAKYFYRKRKVKNSTIDNAMENKSKYNAGVRHGYLALAQFCKEKGYKTLPSFVQNLLYYECYWFFRALVNSRTPNPAQLTDTEQINFIKLMREVFLHITPKTILEFPASITWFYYKVGILGCMKNRHPSYQIAYVEQYDYENNEILVRYFTKEVGDETFTVNGQVITPTATKTVRNTFFSEVFVYQRYLWLPIGKVGRDTLCVAINNLPTKISIKGKLHDSCTLEQIREALPRRIPRTNDAKFKDCWLISDRDTQADDNGEHFYRYVARNHPEINIFFLLNRDSHDWKRCQAQDKSAPETQRESAPLVKLRSCSTRLS